MNILITGVGGQGAVLASKILAQCALARGLSVHTAETIGMAQRGGSVTSHVRLGAGVFSPLIPKGRADALLAFEPAEGVRCLPYLKPDGAAVVSARAVQPSGGVYAPDDAIAYLRRSVPRAVLVDADAVCRLCGSYRPLNIALLGAAASAGAVAFSLEELEAAMRALMSPKNTEASLPALRLFEKTA